MLDFSIIIPTYNRPQRLETCLDSITRLNYQGDLFETIVVDDGSTQPLDEIVAPYRDRIALTLIRQPNSGPATARNTGADAAKGTYLAFTDDDCALDPNWLVTFKQGFSTAPTNLIGGRTVNALSENLYSTASQLLIDYLYQYHNSESSPAQFFASNNFALARELFHKVGQFDVTFPLAAAEDREFCDRWSHMGYTLSYVPESIVYHAHELSLAKFWRQHANYGFGAFHYHQIRLQRGQQQVKSKNVKSKKFSFFYSKLLLYPFWATAEHPKLLLSGLLFISQLAHTIGFLKQLLSQSSIVDLDSTRAELIKVEKLDGSL
jgi:glycosyltransferase involved in cell wall biosynthesis